MSLPVFFPVVEISLRLPAGRTTTLAKLCSAAGVTCRVTGLSASRPLRISVSPEMRVVRQPGELSGVWLGVPRGTPKRRSLLALGILAYAVHDYGARETLRGMPESRASAGPGRPRTGRALASAERRRRHQDDERSTD